MSEYIAIDVETSGFHRTSDRIIELAAYRFSASGSEISRFQSLVHNEGVVIQESAFNTHGISHDMLKDAPKFHEVIRSFIDFLGPVHRLGLGIPILAHNADFDVSFLNNSLMRCYPRHVLHYRVACTLALSRQRNPSFRSHSMKSLVQAHNLPSTNGFHRALADCIHVKNLWLALAGPTYDYSLLQKSVIGSP